MNRNGTNGLCVAVRALHARVAAAEGKGCATVIEARHFPAVGVMALRAVGPQAIFVRILLRVATRAPMGHCAELYVLRMAIHARRAAVFAKQRKVSTCVIEGRWMQDDNRSAATFVFGVAGVAARFFEATVISRVFANVLCDGGSY